MATETLRPNGAGSETNLSIYAPDTGEANWEDVDEAVADDLATALRTLGNGTTYQRDLYACADHSTGSGIINSVTIHWRLRTAGDGEVYSKCALRTHDTTYDGTEKYHNDPAAPIWYDESQVYTENPNTSAAWTWAEIDAIEIGLSAKTGSDAKDCYPTQVYVVVTYTSVTEKASADTGQGTESLPGRAYVLPESGAGSESLISRLLGVTEVGGGTEALLARLLTGTETAVGLEVGAIFFLSADTGAGTDDIINLQALLAGAESGSGTDIASLIKALFAADSGLGADALVVLLVSIVSDELMVGSDRRVAKIESAPKGGDMRLPPGGKTSIPSRRVNL